MGRFSGPALMTLLSMSTVAGGLGTPLAVSAQLLLNEVFYDPDGADGGREFVELYNAGVTTVSLAAVRLEFANGAIGPIWLVRWTGAETDSLVAGGYFLIVDRGWSGDPPGDAEVNLALQNGPDAVRLVQSGGETDLLGYGELEHSELYETLPHPDVVSGHSVGRRPDGHDTDDNARDWTDLDTPTPGAPNFLAVAAEVDLLLCEPPSLSRPGWPVEVTVRLVNTGLEDLPAGRVLLQAGSVALPGWLDPLGPGQNRLLRFDWLPLTAGLLPLQLSLTMDSTGTELTLTLRPFQVGQELLYLSEVMAAPNDGGSEWVEIGNASRLPVELSAFFLRDEDSGWHALPEVELLPGEFVVVVQRREAFLHWWRQVAATSEGESCTLETVSAAVRELPGSWPSLNNAPPEARSFADRVYLGDAEGQILDHVMLGGHGADLPGGRSLERVAVVPLGDPRRNWSVATARRGSTPACRNSLSMAATGTEAFTLRPNPFYPDRGDEESVLHLLFRLHEGERAWEARIFDLWGREVRDLGGDRLGPGPRDVLWDGRSNEGQRVPAGAYVVLLRTYSVDGHQNGGYKQLAVVGTVAPPP